MSSESRGGTTPPVPVLGKVVSAEPSWRLPYADGNGPALAVAYDLTRAGRFRSTWHLFSTRLPALSVPVLVVPIAVTLLAAPGGRSPLFYGGPAAAAMRLLWIAGGAAAGLAAPVALAFLTAAVRLGNGPRARVRIDRAGVRHAAGMRLEEAVPWARVRRVEARGRGDVVFRRSAWLGGDVHIDRCAFADEAAARRFADAARLLHAGRGGEIPEEARREFAAGAGAA